MSKLFALLMALAGAISVPSPASAQVAPRKLNVIMIVADDLTADLSCYGHPLVKTPNLDRLAKRGIRFDRAYCQSPVCNPSRTSFLSGRRAGTKVNDAIFLPNLFREQGYRTIEVGKVTHSYGVTATAIKWDVNQKGRIGNAVEFLKQKQDKPFFLAIGMTETHPGYSFSRKYLDLYPADKLKLVDHSPELLKSLPSVAFRSLSVNPTLSEQDRRKHLTRYYAAISTMDERIGTVLDVLDKQKLWESTVVIFFSDHGRHFGEFGGVYDKRTLFEASVRVPLIVAAPNSVADKECPRPVELLDVYPTLTELCGLPSPKALEGTSLVPLLKDPQQSWKKAAFSRASIRGTRSRSVRTERYRYVEWDGQKKAALFDYQNDPLEKQNLFEKPEQQKVIAELRELLKSTGGDS